MGFFEWFSKPLQNQYADFTGRTSRQAYWMFTLVYIILIVLISIAEEIALGTELPSTLFTLAVIIPSIAITTRRLHDIGKSGWWQLIYFIPILGWIVMLLFLVRAGDRTDNQYGPSSVRPSSNIPPAPSDVPQPQPPIPPASTTVSPSPTSSPVPQPPQNNQ